MCCMLPLELSEGKKQKKKKKKKERNLSLVALSTHSTVTKKVWVHCKSNFLVH